MTGILTVAAKEIQEGMRNRWVLATTILLMALALSITFLGSAPTGSASIQPLSAVVVSLSTLTIVLLPLIALLISHDAIVGEMERGTMLLLLSYPVSRWQVIIGKFLGHVAILTFATCIGFGAAGVALVVSGTAVDSAGWAAFMAMIATSILLGAVFISLGYLASAVSRDRGTAAGIAIGIWMFFVFIFDMALLGILVATQGRLISPGMLDALFLSNPSDVYRIFNTTAFGKVRNLSGNMGLYANSGLRPEVLLTVLGVWILVPLTLAATVFSRREL